MSYHPYQSAPLVPSGVSFFGQANGHDQLHEANNNFVYDSGLDLMHVGNITLNDDGFLGSASYPELIQLENDGTTTINSGVVIQGDLTVNGTQFISQTETVVVADNIILLNSGVTGTPTENAGIEVERGTECNPQLLWDETNEYWAFTFCKDDDPSTLRPIGVARSGLHYDTTFGERHFFDVGAGDGIRVNDADIDVVVGHGLEIDNLTKAVEAVAGTGIEVNADGIHVSLCANSGLTFGDDCFGVLAGSGLLTNDTGLHIGQGDGLTIGADDITVKPYHGINVDTNGVSVDPHHGITVDVNGVSVTDGSGILVDANGVHVNTGDGLEIISDEVRVKAGDAISLDNGEVNVDLEGENEITEPEDSDLLLLQRGTDVQKITFQNLTDELQSIKTIEQVTASQGHDYGSPNGYAYKDVSLVNAGSNSIVLQLPPADTHEGKVLTFKRIDAASDSTYTVRIDGSGTQTIDDAGFKRLYYRYEGMNIISNGSNWFII